MRGFLSFIVLRMIGKQEMSGEDIRKELERRKGCKPSAGTVYPVLKFLKECKLIEELEDSTKEKKYRITKEGQKEIKIATRKFVYLFYDLKEDFNKYPK